MLFHNIIQNLPYSAPAKQLRTYEVVYEKRSKDKRKLTGRIISAIFQSFQANNQKLQDLLPALRRQVIQISENPYKESREYIFIIVAWIYMIKGSLLITKMRDNNV